ncbi:MAG: amidohydrolase [Sebaldella sp.]|nr:amidohydrolase [Sebaldella sp.]
MDNNFIKNNILEIFDEIVKIRREIHMNPELGFNEIETSKIIKKFLLENNIEFKEIAGTGVLGILKNGDGCVIACRADIDALPIIEENNSEYKSKVNGRMHACGHDAHTAIQLGVAKFLSNNRDKWSGTVKFIFQPAEETTGGAKPMIEEGVLENPKVDYIFSLHVAPEIEVGKIGIKYGKMHASSDMFEIKIFGESAHGALPQNGIDAIVIASQLVNYIQTIISRNIDPREEAVITIGKIRGGEVENIICNLVELKGTIRTLSPEVRKYILVKMEDNVKRFVEAAGGRAEVFIRNGYDSVINDDEMTKIAENNAKELFGESNVIKIDKPRMDVEDFSFFLQKARGTFFRLGIRNEEKGIIYDLHHPRFDLDEESIKLGMALQIKNILKVLEMGEYENRR